MLRQPTPGRKNRGFTIVELLIVIVIIAILASLVIVSYGNLTKSAAKEAVKNDLKSVANQLESIRTANRSKNYPTSFPTGFETSPDVGIAITQMSANQFCLNGIHANYLDIKLRYDSVSGFGESHCSGVVVATTGAYEPQDPQDPGGPTYATDSVYGSTAQTFAGAVIPGSTLGPPLAVAQRFFSNTHQIVCFGARIYISSSNPWIGQTVRLGVVDNLNDYNTEILQGPADVFWDRFNTIELAAGWNEVGWEDNMLEVYDDDVWVLMRNETRADIYYQQGINTDVQSLSGSDIWLSATSGPTGNTIWSYKTDAYGNINSEIVEQQRFGLDVLVSLPN